MADQNLIDFSSVPVMWEPQENSGKNMKEFMKKIQEKYHVEIHDYWDIHKWSIEHLPEFWEEMWHLSGIIHSKPYHQVIDLSVPMHKPQEWFAGARLNYAENLLRYRDDHVALIVTDEDRKTERITYAQMYEEVKLYAAALKKHGIKKGDRISCFMSNRKEAIFAMIGATSLGAIWTGALPLMGSQAVMNRFKQAESRILFSVDRFQHNREEKDMLPKLKDIAEGLSSIEKVIIVASKPESKLKDISGIRNSCFLDDFLETGKEKDGSVPEMIFEQVPITHPVFISYTSGTTGLPKPIIHGSGGILSMYRDFLLHCNNSDRSNCWLSNSPVGWISWNGMASMLGLGVTIVLFEGVPYFLSPTFLWDLVDEFGISELFLPPTVLDEIEKRGYQPTERNHLSTLKRISSAGSVVKPQNYDFVYKKIKKDIIFSSSYGCTEMIGSCVNLDRTLKCHKGEIAAPCLGIDIECVDDAGKPVLGEQGELVIKTPTPYLLLGLWGDKDGSLFKKTYFEKYPGKFALGDLATINPVTRGFIIHGRSDDTLKPKGVRFGSSEIYNIVDTFYEVVDSLCVSQYNKDRDERVVLFLKMRNGHLFNEDLVTRIRAAITRELSEGYVPSVVLQTSDIPHNMTGKKMEIVVKKIINKMPYNQETVVNPECLKNFEDVPELQGF